MRAAVFHEHGPLENLVIEEVPTPEPGPGEVRVRVKACGLNRLDVFVRLGWPGLQLPMPHIGGTDVAGVIESVGGGVDLPIGQEVIVNPGLNFEGDAEGNQIVPLHPDIVGETRSGGLAEYVVVPATRVLPKPAKLSFEEAACLPLTLQTAAQMLRKGRLQAGQRILIHGAGGGVSVVTIQLAKAMGAWVAVTAGGPEKAELAKSLGADVVFDYKAEDWVKPAFLATSKEGFDVVIDNVGAATWAGSVRSLRPGGRLVTCGATTGPKGDTHIQLVFWKQLEIIGSTMGTPADLAWALEWVEKGKVRPIVDTVYPLEEARVAQKRLEDGDVLGKIILTP